MRNERDTEKIVRDHFYNDEKIYNVIFEEQISKNKYIDKLLKYASKSGQGKGYPEFIISNFDKSIAHNLIIVIECKADIKKHESKEGNKYSEYAVDGVLQYSSVLSKNFDVISIAVSGNEKDNKISHFFQAKQTQSQKAILGSELLTIDEYQNFLYTSNEKKEADFQELMLFSRELNEDLHKLKIPESQRSYLISGALIALQNERFKQSYFYEKIPKELTKFFINTIISTLENSDLQQNKIDKIKSSFSFIEANTIFNKDEKILKDIILNIDIKVNSFYKNYKYFDILGQFYIEFLKYANSDKGLGIVLTPPHITEFFTKIAKVNKDSIVYDNCTGTAGFLISSMKAMVSDAKGNSSKIKTIKKEQIIGVEYQPHIYTLAVSNMILHGDGKSNIILGDCFDDDVIFRAEKSKPDIGFLNPPYKTKKDSIHEMEFILNNLEVLQKNGTCIAIIPLSCVLANKGDGLRFKEKLLKTHTLQAVFSMPDELFNNSKVAVNSCIIIVKAKQPHPINKEVFFGRYKEDGFIKRKYKGRIDENNTWNEIERKWIDLYENKKNIKELSVLHTVTPESEWCAEAYLEIDYTNISVEEFQLTLIDYFNFIVKHKRIKINRKHTDKKTQNSFNAYSSFQISDLFNIERGKVNNLTFLPSGKTPIISAYGENQGVSFFGDVEAKYRNCITASFNGSKTGYFAYHEYDFNAGSDCGVMIPKIKMNKYIGIYFATILKKMEIKYLYGRKLSKDRLENEWIELPVNLSGEIDFDAIENFISSLEYSEYI